MTSLLRHSLGLHYSLVMSPAVPH